MMMVMILLDDGGDSDDNDGDMIMMRLVMTMMIMVTMVMKMVMTVIILVMMVMMTVIVIFSSFLSLNTMFSWSPRTLRLLHKLLLISSSPFSLKYHFLGTGLDPFSMAPLSHFPTPNSHSSNPCPTTAPV